MTGKIRFEAEWIAKQHVDADGEWNPDRDEYAASYHATKEAAEKTAIASSIAAGQCEWICIKEQRYVRGEWVRELYTWLHSPFLQEFSRSLRFVLDYIDVVKYY